MRMEIVVNTKRRILTQAPDGSMIEIATNPKTEIAPAWLQIAARQPHLHIHIESADGDLLTPGARRGGKARLPVAAIAFVLGFAGGLAALYFWQGGAW